MKVSKPFWYILIIILAGALCGGFLGEFLSQYQFFSWMSFGGTGYRLISLDLNPLINTHILEFGFNLAIRFNMGTIIGIFLFLLAFGRRS